MKNRVGTGVIGVLSVILLTGLVASDAFGQGDCGDDQFECGLDCCWMAEWGDPGETCAYLRPQHVFGVVTQSAPNSDYDRAVEMNMKWARVDMNWATIEKTKGQYKWNKSDGRVTACNQRNLLVVGLLHKAPNWATTNGTQQGPLTAEGQHHWVDFVTAIASRYPSVTYWEPWNEPNSTTFWKGTVSQYFSQILKPATLAVRAINPNSVVIAPTLSNSTGAGLSVGQFFDLLPPDASLYVDIIGQNYYDGSSFNQLSVNWQALEQHYNRNGFSSQPIWIMETGKDTTIEIAQADYIERMMYWQGYFPRIDNVFVFKLRDSGSKHFGVLRSDGSPKAAYYRLVDIYQLRCECRNYPWCD